MLYPKKKILIIKPNKLFSCRVKKNRKSFTKITNKNKFSFLDVLRIKIIIDKKWIVRGKIISGRVALYLFPHLD